MPLSDLERALMRHALGLGRSKVPYRNDFVAEQDDDHTPTWRGLVDKGLATERRYTGAPNCLLFSVTQAGKAALASAERKANE